MKRKKYYLFKLDMKTMNLVATLIMILVFAFTFLVLSIFPDRLLKFELAIDSNKFLLRLLPLFIVYMVLHELLHALAYIIYGANPKKITFGMAFEKGILFCLSKQDVSKKAILNSLMYPLFYIGIITYIISIIFNIPILLILSTMNITGATGDMLYFKFICKLDNNIAFSECDDPTSFAILSDHDVSNYKHFGLKYIGAKDDISRKNFKRIEISKLSWIILVISIILLILSFFA